MKGEAELARLNNAIALLESGLQTKRAMNNAVGAAIGAVAVKQWATDLGAAVDLIPSGWWWHISHLEAQVLPTVPGDGRLAGVISNGRFYEKSGRPTAFTSLSFERENLPRAVCCAYLKARRALLLPRPLPRKLQWAGIRELRKANPKFGGWKSWSNWDSQYHFHWCAIATERAMRIAYSTTGE